MSPILPKRGGGSPQKNPYDLDEYLKNKGPDSHFGPDAT
jgi:hypothetical protein